MSPELPLSVSCQFAVPGRRFSRTMSREISGSAGAVDAVVVDAEGCRLRAAAPVDESCARHSSPNVASDAAAATTATDALAVIQRVRRRARARRALRSAREDGGPPWPDGPDGGPEGLMDMTVRRAYRRQDRS